MKPALLFLPLLLLLCSPAASSAEDSPPPEHCANAIQRCHPHLEAAAPAGIASSSQPQSIEDCREAFSAAISGGATCIFHPIQESAINGSTTSTSRIFSLPSSCDGKLANASAASSLDQICQVARKISATKVASQPPPPPPPPRQTRPPNRIRKIGFFITVPAAGPPLPAIRVPSPPPPPGPLQPVFPGHNNGTGRLKFALPVFIFFLVAWL